ncbi:hypothetical protein R1sor_012120 [Riccia sorocarpa]|uniref:DNA excision repair protein ERCC-1 n=1 Tax=Riccia sorocarpa TaxID=122646 RepID=A0ABD3I912_9MARC
MGESQEQDSSTGVTRRSRIPARLPFIEPESPVPRNSTNAASSLAGNGHGSSFTEAFSFLRNTEFYSPPPPKPAAPPSAPASTSSGAAASTATIAPLDQEVNLASLSAQARNQILVSRRQQGNPILKHIRNVRWMFMDIVPDYILGQTSCALYLSLRYHLLHPDYIYHRIRELTKGFRLRVVLCHVDVDDVIKPLHEVTKTCLLHDCSLLCAWSQEECARYLETIKSYENKPADYIQERTDNDYLSRLTNALTTVRHVNKTNVVSLGAAFGTLAGVFQASMDDLARCPGIGERKVKRLYDAFHEPFRRVPAVKVKVEGADVGDVTSSLVSEAQTQVPGASGSGDQAGEGNTSLGQESIPTSKLISREGDVSLREALNAARSRVNEKSGLLTKDEASPSKRSLTSPTKKGKISPNKRKRVVETSNPAVTVDGQLKGSSSPATNLETQSSTDNVSGKIADNLEGEYIVTLDDD